MNTIYFIFVILLSLLILLFSQKQFSLKKKLPKDVLIKLSIDFPDINQRKFVENELIKIINEPIPVGEDQLSRSIVYLSNGNIEQFKKVITFDDHRDIIQEAENKNGNPGHYFTIPFS